MSIVRLPTSPLTVGLMDLSCTFFDATTNTVLDVQPCVEMDICPGVYEARTDVIALDLWSHVTSPTEIGINAVSRVLPNLLTLGSGLGVSGVTNVDSALETAYEQSILNVVQTTATDTQSLIAKAEVLQSEVSQLQASSTQSTADAATILSSLDAIRLDTEFIRNIEGGRWHVEGVFMIFYDELNQQEIARFQMLDSNGNPTTNPMKAYQRLRV